MVCYDFPCSYELALGIVLQILRVLESAMCSDVLEGLACGICHGVCEWDEGVAVFLDPLELEGIALADLRIGRRELRKDDRQL